LAASDKTVESRPNGDAERESGAADLAEAIATSDGMPTPDCPREQLAKSAYIPVSLAGFPTRFERRLDVDQGLETIMFKSGNMFTKVTAEFGRRND